MAREYASTRENRHPRDGWQVEGRLTFCWSGFPLAAMAFLASSNFVWNNNNTTIKQKHQGELDNDGQRKEGRGLQIKQISMPSGTDCVLSW